MTVQAMTSPAVDVCIHRKLYRGKNGALVEAIANLAFRAEGGKLTALIGPSGCGKTTTLRIIAGLDQDYDGEVAMPEGRRIGFVFQEPRLLAWKTVEQNICLAMAAAGLADKDLSDLYAALGLEGIQSRYPSELSLGLARRVAIARALAIEPDLLILDEPSASLDETTAAKMRQLLQSIVTGWRPTALLVTHNIREALMLADQLVLLAPSPGRVIGSVSLDTPQAERDTAFIEATRMNLMEEYPQTIA